MKKFLVLCLSSAFIFSCNNQSSNLLPVNNNEVNTFSSDSKMIEISDRMPSTIKVKSSSNLKKTNSTSSLEKVDFIKFKKKTNLKSSPKQVETLKKALVEMEKAVYFDKSVEIGRKAVIDVSKELINTADKDYDMTNILNNSLVFARVQEQDPKNYDDDSVKSEYVVLLTTLKSILELGPSESGIPQNLAIFTLNARKSIDANPDVENKDSKIRDSFYLGNFSLTLYSKQKEYSPYAEISKKTLELIVGIKDLKDSVGKIYKTIDGIATT
ncbi:MAG: hypothetical protein AABZ74_09915 [Cyanobacteriota bacterium]